MIKFIMTIGDLDWRSARQKAKSTALSPQPETHKVKGAHTS